MLLIVSAYAVIRVVQRSEEDHGGSWWRRNEITIVMTLISFLFPMLFEILGLIEYYHPRMQLRLQLARIMVLNLLNLYSLIWALFGKIHRMLNRMEVIDKHFEDVKNNKTILTTVTTTTTTIPASVQTQNVLISTPLYSTLDTSNTELTTSTIKTITESVFARITEITSEILSSFKNTTEDTTELYDYSNLDYFETEPSISTTEQPFYDDIENITSEFITNTSNIFLNFNLTNIVTQVAPNFEDYYYTDYNDSIASANAVIPENIPLNLLQETPLSVEMHPMNQTIELELRRLCWETMFGQGN